MDTHAEYFGGILLLLRNKMLGTLQLKTISSVWGSVQFFVPRECTLDSKSNVTSVQLLINCRITMFICRQDVVWVFLRVCKTNICVYVDVIVYYIFIIYTYYIDWTQKGLSTAQLPGIPQYVPVYHWKPCPDCQSAVIICLFLNKLEFNPKSSHPDLIS